MLNCIRALAPNDINVEILDDLFLQVKLLQCFSGVDFERFIEKGLWQKFLFYYSYFQQFATTLKAYPIIDVFFFIII